MDIFNVLTLVGGLCLFLFGMNLMGQALERRAGGKLRSLLDKMTSRVFVGFLTGLGITAIIQSSSATTVMVVGFVNSGLMTLRQAINVIMGANVGTTVTAWLLSLAGIDSGSLWIRLLKPSSFTPVLALVGIIFYMFCKDAKKKDTGTILLGFATLMFGMETMSGAVAGLKDVPEFTQLFLMFRNPVLGVLVGAVLTGIIQSSSASVGILQALSVTGSVSYAAAIPIIMGQNIGTCVTAILSSVGTNKNARRAAVVHLMFNVIGVVVLLTVYCVVKALFAPAILDRPATMYGIAIAHSVFNILCTAMLLPAGGLLEKLAIRLVPDAKRREETVELDSRLLATPALALGRAQTLAPAAGLDHDDQAGFCLAMASARLTPCTTPAGALDAYGKAVLEGNGIYRALCAPIDQQADLAAQMESFAQYAFNKPHAAAYAVVAYQTAYLKRHYPLPFMAACMNSVVGNSDKLAGFIQYCRKNNLRVLPPDVNRSGPRFTVENGAIRYGLSALKGAGSMEAAEAAVEAAKGTKTVPMHSFSGVVEHALDTVPRAPLTLEAVYAADRAARTAAEEACR